MSAASERELPVGVGDVIDGKFEIRKVLGVGGMGSVVEAHHIRLDQRVALKFIHRDLARDEELNRRFLREAQAAARLRSEHVCRVLDAATLSDGTPYIVMEFLEGRDLGHVLRTDGPLPVEDAVEYVFQVCEAIAEAHAAGIIHRDLKPQNLFLTRRPTGLPLVKVVDFGISKLDDGSTGGRTATDKVIGSPAYMSPEQLRSTREADARSDIWSLGVVLYELLAAHLPFRGHNLPSLALAIVSETQAPIDGSRQSIPEGLVAVIGRCLEKDPADRFSSVAELAAALRPFGPESARATMAAISQALRIEGSARRPPTRRRAALVGALVAVGLAALAAVGVSRSRHADPGARAESPVSTRANAASTNRAPGLVTTSAPATGVAREQVPTGTPYVRGVWHLRRWEGTSARVALEEAVATAPRDPMARLQLCRALSLVGDDDGAATQARRGLALERIPEDTRRLIEACGRYAAGDGAGAVSLYREAFANDPQLEIGLDLGDSQVAAEDATGLESTVAALRSLPAPDRHDSRIDVLEGDSRELRQDLAGAREHFARAAARAAVEGMPVVRAFALLWEGSVLRRQGLHRDANESFDEAHGLFVDAGERQALWSLLHIQSIVFHALGQHRRGASMNEEALERRLLDDGAGPSVTMTNLAAFRFLLGDHDAGRRGIEEFARLGKEHREDWAAYAADQFRAWERLHAGDAGAAVRLFRAGRPTDEKSPKDLHWVYFPGEALLLAGDLPAARNALEEATNRATRASWLSYAECARVLLASTALAEGKAIEAEVLVRRGLSELDRMEVRDCRVRGRVVLSRALRAQGKADAAHTAVGEAAAMSSEDVRVRWELETAVAEDEIARGDATAARARLARAIDEAQGLHIPDAALDAAVVLGELELSDPSTAAEGRARLEASAKRARVVGQRLVEKRIAAVLARPVTKPAN
jgi:tRNA A-37 threonylcarbamoyl transferase component Bud32/tetratricopeptide (TPR) repeat protein